VSRAPRSFASAAVSTYGTNVAVAALSLVNVLIVARGLGPSGRGSVAFLTTIANLTSQLFALGVHQANVNLASRDPKMTRTLAANSLILAAATGLAAVGLLTALIAVAPSVAGGSSTGLRWLALGSVPFLILGVYIQQLLVAHEEFGVNNVAWLIGPVVNVAVNGTLAITGHLSVGAAVGSWVVGQLLALAVMTSFLMRRLGGFGRPDLRLARGMLGFGVKTHLTRVLTLSNYRLDQWLMGAMVGTRQLGYYSVAVAWGEALFFLPTTLALVQRPALARADDRGAAGRRVAPVVRLALLLTAVLAIAMIVAAPLLCVTIFGKDFAPSVGQLRVLALGAFGIVVLKLLGNTLTAQGRPLLETAAVSVSAVAIIALDLILIPHHAGMGAAIASTVAYSAGGVAILVIGTRHFGLALRELLPGRSDLRAVADLVSGLRRRGGGAAPSSS
jgi:O-antigen/teichoic acid export membrane protein